MSQSKLNTSEEVSYRIRWDARFDEQEFVIGYESHVKGMLEVPLADFVPGGDIPWHRVWYIRRGAELARDPPVAVREAMDDFATAFDRWPERPRGAL